MSNPEHALLPLLLFMRHLGGSLAAEDCNAETDCLKCGSVGCMKCTEFITYPTRKCVPTCPYGYRPQWSTMSDYMGKMCVNRGTFMGLSNESLTVLTGILTGTLLCVVIISFAVMYIQYKKKTAVQASETGSDLDDSPERKEFLKQVEVLRPYAHTFLDILNDTRRQLRESHQEGDNSAASVYRPIVRDLAKILILLNRPSDKMGVPEEWEHLFNWAEKTLKRCKRMSEISQPQVAQLISFLQSPIEPENARSSTTMSTFKPDQPFGSTTSLQDHAVKGFNENYDTNLNPQWKFDYTLINSLPGSQFNPMLWTNSKENLNHSYFLDDDFYQLGFRPQDEITTEL